MQVSLFSPGLAPRYWIVQRLGALWPNKFNHFFQFYQGTTGPNRNGPPKIGESAGSENLQRRCTNSRQREEAHSCLPIRHSPVSRNVSSAYHCIIRYCKPLTSPSSCCWSGRRRNGRYRDPVGDIHLHCPRFVRDQRREVH